MRDDDVGLSEGERAAFDDLARRLTDDRVVRNERRHRRFDRRRRRTVTSWMLLTAGCAALLTGLFAGHLWISGAGVLVLVTALHRLTRRWNWARTVLWWRRQGAAPPPPDHMWEP